MGSNCTQAPMSVPVTHMLGTPPECARFACRRGQQAATFRTQDSASPSKLLNPFPKYCKTPNWPSHFKKKRISSINLFFQNLTQNPRLEKTENRPENVKELSVISVRGISSVATSSNFMSKQPLAPEFPVHPHPQTEGLARQGAEAARPWLQTGARHPSGRLCFTHRENKCWQVTKKEHVLQTIGVT